MPRSNPGHTSFAPLCNPGKLISGFTTLPSRRRIAGQALTISPQCGQVAGRRTLDREVEVRGRRPGPTRMPHRRPACFLRVGRGCFVPCNVFVRRVLLRRAGLVLPFQLQLEPGLRQLYLEHSIELHELGVAFSLGVNGPVQAINGRVRVIRPQHPCLQRRTTRMRVVPDIWGRHVHGLDKSKTASASSPVRKQGVTP